MVPVVETARLRLRGQRAEDFVRHAAMYADEAVVRFLGGTPLSAEETWRKMLASTGLWSMLGYGYWTIERKEDGRAIGLAGFGDFKRDLTPSILGLPEMGWIMAGDVHGSGYASEAVAAALQWIDEAMPGTEVPAIIHPENLPSIRLAEKVGFTVRENARYGAMPILLFRRPARLPAAAAATAATAA